MENAGANAAAKSQTRARFNAFGDRIEKMGNGATTRDEQQPAQERTLYVVATPLGNLRDITLRALDILGQVDTIAAEDTRVTGVLLRHYQISTRLLSLHEHNERKRAPQIIALLAAGKRVALVTDAGTPAISDPGAALIRAVTDAGYAVVPIPGPSAVTTALSASGLSAPQWLFCGFLPAAKAARRAELARVGALSCALVIYETPHRIVATLGDLAAELAAERTLVIARELTKRFESIHRCTLAEGPAWVAADPMRQRGEFVLIVDADEKPIAEPAADAHDATLNALLADLPLAQAVRLAVTLTGAPRKKLYERALALKDTKR